MTTTDNACDAMTEWWRGFGERSCESISVPCSRDVVRQFLHREPMFQIHEAALREWAKGRAWVITRAKWDVIRSGDLAQSPC